LLLRGVVGIAVAVQGGLCLAAAPPAIGMALVGLLAIVSGIALTIGFLTPASGILVALATILMVVSWTPPASTELLVDGLAVPFVLADAVALVLLGPGALSLDARLFGRREIIIPHDVRNT
jgi:uncharacterized membrane protein YphA (DoxX/SURF4 family)